MSNLPDEIIEEILARLPAKSLVRFNSVCKQWQSLISLPNFVRKHLNHVLLEQQQRNNHRKLIVNSSPYFYSIDCYYEESLNFFTSTKLDFPLHSPIGIRILGSCNGLLLIGFCNKNLSYNALVLWNPLLRENYNILPECSSVSISGGYVRLIGFGYDSSIDDYKVLAVVTDSELHDIPMCDLEHKVEIYTLKTNSWKGIQGIPYGNLYTGPGIKGTVVNGSIYWVVACADLEDDENDIENLVLAFDLVDEKFRLVGAPRDDDLLPTWKCSLAEVRGCLGLYLTRYGFPEDDILLLKEDENQNEYWSKLMRIPKELRRRYGLPAFFMKKDEVLLSITSDDPSKQDKMLVVFNPEKRKFRNLTSCGISAWSEELIYVETLVSPNGLGG